MRSMTVTVEPSRAQTLANSRPIAPPPTIANRFGTRPERKGPRRVDDQFIVYGNGRQDARFAARGDDNRPGRPDRGFVFPGDDFDFARSDKPRRSLKARYPVLAKEQFRNSI
jgi:hypothetical protein